MSLKERMREGTKNFLETATADEGTRINEEELVGDGQLGHDKEVCESQDQVAASRVPDHVHSADLAGEGVEDGQVPIDDVVEGRRELVLGRHTVLDDEDGEGGVEGDAVEATGAASAAAAFPCRR